VKELLKCEKSVACVKRAGWIAVVSCATCAGWITLVAEPCFAGSAIILRYNQHQVDEGRDWEPAPAEVRACTTDRSKMLHLVVCTWWCSHSYWVYLGRPHLDCEEHLLQADAWPPGIYLALFGHRLSCQVAWDVSLQDRQAVQVVHAVQVEALDASMGSTGWLFTAVHNVEPGDTQQRAGMVQKPSQSINETTVPGRVGGG
jgi:hypothetical protein